MRSCNSQLLQTRVFIRAKHPCDRFLSFRQRALFPCRHPRRRIPRCSVLVLRMDVFFLSYKSMMAMHLSKLTGAHALRVQRVLTVPDHVSAREPAVAALESDRPQSTTDADRARF